MAETKKLFANDDLPEAATPAMRQYARFKKEHPGSVLLFRMGDFYETFFEDAKTLSRVCGLTLTSRAHGESAVPLAGFPYHSIDTYLKRLIVAGHKVAVCDQVQDPREAKGVVDRDVTRVVTPGTLTEESLLDAKANNFLAAIAPLGKQCGLAWVDLSTGRFLVQEVEPGQLLDELGRVGAAECLLPDSQYRTEDSVLEPLRPLLHTHWTPRPDWAFDPASGRKALLEHFGVASLEGFGCQGLKAGLGAAGAVLDYLAETQRGSLGNLTRLEHFLRSDYLILDKATQASLELVETLRTRRADATLLRVLDATVTPMGGRLFRQMVLYPLRDVARIRRRQEAVAELVAQPLLRGELRTILRNVHDIERIASKIAYRRANPRDVVGLKQSANALPTLKGRLAACTSPHLAEIQARLDTLDDVRDLIERSIVADPPTSLTDGGIIRSGYHAKLDEERSIARDGKSWLARFQADEIRRTGIESLKVGYNQVFGYYIEVTHANADRVPPGYTRKQTLKNAERYITPELKEWEERIVGADERAKELERDLFVAVRDEIAGQVERLQRVGALVAEIDGFAALAHVAAERGYCAPEIADDLTLRIEEGRHPVLEVSLESGKFVPNDLLLDGDKNRMAVITGPNMAGKSTYIRQAALLVLMAQMGSFIPAKRAHIGVADRIFTRVGASDELARGQSTFMVEMIETANILNNATERSLLVLDEVGRGTSTFDGVSIAWAVCEFLHEHVRARTLFATHYHELTELALLLDGVRNYNVAVREWKDEIIFLHKIVEGGADKSYGIHVARLAGIPRKVIQRAKVILGNLEAASLTPNDKPRFAPTLDEVGAHPRELQLTLFGSLHADTIEELKRLDLDNLTPLDALAALQRFQRDILRRESQGKPRK
ncbi:MAG TPA: DNA mismatch repair protein MutS [Planctomycetota bacterium]|nr:DNA mismatch repair protein MutS [Planctomycetota bacterium]HRR81935.1 DNA mismatch repair protein MutS [Planctomycetota bacterium]HRT96343.1 DNA mismatch repair protein MutS [Planctomycetota bacterium]